MDMGLTQVLHVFTEWFYLLNLISRLRKGCMFINVITSTLVTKFRLDMEKEKKGKERERIVLDHHSQEIIVSAAAYPCPYPHRHHHLHRLIRNSAITCQQIPCRQVVPQYEPSDHHDLAVAKVDRVRRIVRVNQPLSPTQLEKQIRGDHRSTSDGDDDRNEICFYWKRSHPRCYSRPVEHA